MGHLIQQLECFYRALVPNMGPGDHYLTSVDVNIYHNMQTVGRGGRILFLTLHVQIFLIDFYFLIKSLLRFLLKNNVEQHFNIFDNTISSY